MTRYSAGMTPFQKGSPFTKSGTLNSILETAEDFQARKLGRQSAGRTETTDSNRAKVKNNSGGSRRKGEILEFTDFVLNDDQLNLGYIWLTGDLPTLQNGFGVLIKPLPEGGISDCQLMGVCAALVNVTDSAHHFAAPANGNAVLQSAEAGPVRIIYKPDTGEQLCVVLIEGARKTVKRKIFVMDGSTGPLRIDSGYLQGYLVDAAVELLGDPAWTNLIETDSCT